MKKALLMLVLASFLSLGFAAAGAYAASTLAKGDKIFDSIDVIGAPVMDFHGELLGIVNEVMVDSSGHAFAIVTHGDFGLTGSGSINTPVPFQELRIYHGKAGQYTVVLKTDTEYLDFAPYLDPLQMNSRHYEASIYEYYGIQPYWTQSGGLSK